jgi:hypothetical protein
VLREKGRAVAVVDSSAAKLERLREEGVVTIRGDARDAMTFEQAGVQRDTQVVALTTNDELNLLIAELVRDEFAVEHPVVALQRVSEEFGTVRRAWTDLLGGRAVDLPTWIRRLETGNARLVTLDLSDEEDLQRVRRLIDPEADGVLPLVAWREDVPSFRFRPEILEEIDRLTAIVPSAEVPAEVRPLVEQAVEDVPAIETEEGDRS